MHITRLGPDPTDAEVAQQEADERRREDRAELAALRLSHLPHIDGPVNGHWWVRCYACRQRSDALDSLEATLALHATWHPDTKEPTR